MEKRQERVFVCMMCLSLLALPVFFLVSGLLLPAQYEHTFLGELKYKCQALRETEGKRIVIVGGSSVAFGIDSSIIEENFADYTVINFGMYAGLGTTVMLDLSLDAIRPGDIVILSPEQEAQTLSDYFNAEAMWQAADGDFRLLSDLSGEKKKAMAGQLPYFAVDKFHYYIRQNAPETTGVYSRESFSESGDLVSLECASNIMPGGYDANMGIVLKESVLAPDFVEKVNAYVEELSVRGAAVWYRFCPMNALAVEEGADVDAYYDYLDSKLECDIIGNPNDCIMDAAWFYDTNFHLNSSGKIVNTYQLIRDMKAMLLDSSPTQIRMPEKPPYGAERFLEGDNTDADCFTCEKQDGMWILTGLTKEGREKEKLAVPVYYDGVQVTAIGEGAFSENTVVKTIVLPENITFISDGAFAGCSRLERIVKEGNSPEKCRIGQELLEGTTAQIVVEKAAVSDYKVNYFWSVYADRIVSE